MAASPPLLRIPYLLLHILSATIFAAKPTTTPTIPTTVSDQQRANLIQALTGVQDFADLANAFSTADPSTNFPLTATLFLPKDGDGNDENDDDLIAKDPITLFNNVSVPRFLDPAILGYHIVPQLLSFSDLQRFAVGSRLPTLIPDESLVVTNNSRLNYTIDGVRITRPDLYIGGPIAVHGIASVLGLKQSSAGSGSSYVGGNSDGVLDCDQQRSNGSDGNCNLWTEFWVLCFPMFFALFWGL